MYGHSPEPTIWPVKSSKVIGNIIMNKASGGDRIPAEIFKILKDYAVIKVLYSICQQSWKTQQVATGLQKVSFHYNPKKGQYQRMFKLPHNCTHFIC